MAGPVDSDLYGFHAHWIFLIADDAICWFWGLQFLSRTLNIYTVFMEGVVMLDTALSTLLLQLIV